MLPASCLGIVIATADCRYLADCHQSPASACIATAAGDFMRMGVAREDRAYQQLPDQAALAAALDGYLQEHNAARPSDAMQLVMFGDFVQHVARLARVLRQPRGSALLLGAGGSGKRSVARLACHVSDTQLCTLEVTRGYGLAEFRWALLPGRAGSPHWLRLGCAPISSGQAGLMMPGTAGYRTSRLDEPKLQPLPGSAPAGSTALLPLQGGCQEGVAGSRSRRPPCGASSSR
jgi:hypothetical protein